MTDIRAKLADALRKHVEVHDRFTQRHVCTCDNWTEDSFDDAFGHQTHAAHLADVLLALEGVAVVDMDSGTEVLDRAAQAIWRNGQPSPWDELKFRRMARAALLAATEVER